MFLCKLSGTVPTHPVFTPEGHVYERRYIEQHLDKSQTDPVTGKPLKKEDLISVNMDPVVEPSKAVSLSVAGLTQALNDHFDTLLLELAEMRKERDACRQQLTHLMYLRDGATRVVGRQLAEIETLKRKIEELESEDLQPRKKQTRVSQNVETYEQFVETLSTIAKQLLAARKTRQVIAKTSEELAKFKQQVFCHEAGASCFDILFSDMEQRPQTIAVGTSQGELKIVDRERGVISTIQAHSGNVNCVTSVVFPNVTHSHQTVLGNLNAASDKSDPFASPINILTAGDDGTVKLWRSIEFNCMDDLSSNGYLEQDSKTGAKYIVKPLEQLTLACEHVFQLKKGPVKSIKIHAMTTHAIVATAKEGFTVLNLPRTQILHSYESPTTLEDVTIQADGNLVLGAGSDGSIPVWDLRTKELKATLACPTGGKITSLDFSEIGYIVVSTSSSGHAHLWDLRKAEMIQEYEFSAPVNRARFDHSGKHVVFSGEDGLQIYSSIDKKKLGLVSTLEKGQDIIDAKFNHLNDQYILGLRKNGDFLVLR